MTTGQGPESSVPPDSTGGAVRQSRARTVREVEELAAATVPFAGSRINDIVNQAVLSFEKYRDSLKKGLLEAAYIDYCHSKIILYDEIPSHPKYQLFTTKADSAFRTAYGELLELFEHEDVSELRRKLDAKSSKPKVVRRPVGLPSSSASPSPVPTHTDMPTNPDDQLTARFQRLRPRNSMSQPTKPASVVAIQQQQQHQQPHPQHAMPHPQPHHQHHQPQPSVIFPKTNVINSETLHRYLQAVPDSILLLDVRERRCFDGGHIAAPHVVCIEPVTILPGKTENDIEDSLILSPLTERFAFENRSKFELIVYYDHSSETKNFNPSKQDDPQAAALHNLITSIHTYAYSKKLKREPCLLIGGIRSWVEDINGPLYPHDGKLLLPSGSPELQKATLSDPMGNMRISPPVARDMNGYFRGGHNSQMRYDLSPPKSHIYSSHATPSPTPYQISKAQRPSAASSNGAYSSSSHSIDNKPHVAPMTIPTPNGYTQHEHSNTSANSHASQPNGHSMGVQPYQPPTQQQQQQQQQQQYAYAPPRVQYHTKPNGHNGHSPAPPPFKGGLSREICTGLRNLGNTCYMNSVIQCLAGTPSFATPFFDGSYTKYINVSSKLGYKGAFAKTFADLVQTMYRPEVSVVGPNALKNLSGSIRDTFAGYDQQDCQEFLTFLLDSLHEDINASGHRDRLKNLTAAEERRREELSVRQASTIEWERYLKSDYSLVVDTFQGQYQSRLKCLTCGFTSTTYSAFCSITLPIPAHSRTVPVTLADCFDQFIRPEILDGEDAWHCAKCQKPRRTEKTLRIARLPQALIVHLKRFTRVTSRLHSNPGAAKLETFVHYPFSIDLTKYWPAYTKDDEVQLAKFPPRGQVPPFNYTLYAVANHFGTLKGGHYTAFVEKGAHGWCYFDDTNVRRAHPQEVINQHAYVLFYQRV